MSDSTKESEGLSYNAKTGQRFKDGQSLNPAVNQINKLARPSKPKWSEKDETLLAELLARRSEFREQQDASIAEFLDRIALTEIYKHWRILEKNADEAIALLKPFSRLTSSS